MTSCLETLVIGIELQHNDIADRCYCFPRIDPDLLIAVIILSSRPWPVRYCLFSELKGLFLPSFLCQGSGTIPEVFAMYFYGCPVLFSGIPCICRLSSNYAICRLLHLVRHCQRQARCCLHITANEATHERAHKHMACSGLRPPTATIVKLASNEESSEIAPRVSH